MGKETTRASGAGGDSRSKKHSSTAVRRRASAASARGKGRERADGMPLSLAGRTARKARGLLLSRPSSEALLLMPCNDVHTVGMQHRLDIAFVDATGCVVECHRDVGPFRRLRNRSAVAVVERFSTCASPWFSLGDRVGVVSVEGGRP